MSKTLFGVLATIFIACILSNGAFAAGAKAPVQSAPPTQSAPPPPAPPAPQPPTAPTPPPVVDSQPGPSGVVGEAALLVDKYYGDDELKKTRVYSIGSDPRNYDKCQQPLIGDDRFADRMAFFVDDSMYETRPEIGDLSDPDSVGGLYSVRANPIKVSLMSHAMCAVTSTSLGKTLAAYKTRRDGGTASNVPSTSTINQINDFVKKYNSYRSGVLAGNESAALELRKIWTRVFGCLSYIESLTSADTSTSTRIATREAPSGYRKPAGVLFYDDPSQDAASRLNIGLFQFTPTYSGNINACVKRWKTRYPSCGVSATTKAEMIRLIGSPLQNFNSFCGVDKVLQSFFVQVNTTNTYRTHTSNNNGGLKDPRDRCVSLHFNANQSYNHFGPFQNSTGGNLSSLMKCVMGTGSTTTSDVSPFASVE